jgi:hypothetical protein
MLLRPEYLSQELDRRLATKDGGILRTIRDACIYMTGIGKQRELRILSMWGLNAAAQTRIVLMTRIRPDSGNLCELSKGYFPTTFLSSSPTTSARQSGLCEPRMVSVANRATMCEVAWQARCA